MKHTFLNIKNRLKIFHLIYADNILLVSKAKGKSCRSIVTILKPYETLTNQF